MIKEYSLNIYLKFRKNRLKYQKITSQSQTNKIVNGNDILKSQSQPNVH